MRESQTETVPAVRVNARGAEAVAVSLDVDIPCHWTMRRENGEPGGNRRARDQNQQRGQAPHHCGFAARTLPDSSQDRKNVSGRARRMRLLN